MLSHGLRVLPRRLLAMGTALIAFYLVLATGQRALEAYRIQQQVDDVRHEIQRLQARNVALQDELASGRLDEDIERIGREELGLIRPGDKPLTLLWPDGALRNAPTAVPPAPPRQEANWVGWLRLFVDTDVEARP
jgi:cell division protein FtsB